MKKTMRSVLPTLFSLVLMLSLTACGGGSGAPVVIIGNKIADTQAPSVPLELKTNASDAGEIVISWTASQDNIAVNSYQIYRDSTLVGTMSATETRYIDHALVGGSTHQYQARACDAAGNCSALSAILTAIAGSSIPSDTVPPSIPLALTTTGSTKDSISLVWQASTDNISVVGYEIWRNGSRINTGTTSTIYVDTGLAAATDYSYTVRALDAAGNNSAPSNELRASTRSLTSTVDSTVPTSPTGLKIIQSSANSLSLSWVASTDNVGIARYDLYQNANLVGSVGASNTFYTYTGLISNTRYQLTVQAIDPTGNKSTMSNILEANTLASPAPMPDTAAPSVPTGLLLTQSTPNSLTLNWSASSDNVGVVAYELYKDSILVGSSVIPGFIYTGLAVSTAYKLSVKAVDAAGNRSALSAILNATTQGNTPPADSIAPTIPTGLVVTQAMQNSLTIGWVASTDNVGVVRYELLLNGNAAGSSTTTSFTYAGLAASTSYVLSVKAVDAAGNKSGVSATLQADTPSAGNGNAGAVALNVRVQGLGLGGLLKLSHGQASLTAAMNDGYSFVPQVPAGAALDLRVSVQPTGQTCAVSDSAPANVPADASPVFVRCVYNSAAKINMPDTLPNKALSTNFDLREFAYPGVAYESRPGVVGGIFPYEYRIKSLTLDGVAQSTSGVMLDFRRGTVRFTPAVEGNYVLTLEIKDSGSTQKTLEKSFAIQSVAAKFLFVATGGLDSAGRGSRALPYKTVAFAVAQSSPTQLIVLRKGSYITASFSLRDNHSKQIIAYPDEVVTLDLNKAGNIGINSDLAPAARLEGLDIIHVKQYGIVSDPSRAGLIVRNVRFVDGEEGSTPRENPAFIHGLGDSVRPWRHKLLVQDNDFGIYIMKSSGAYALTLFDAGESLIENNQIRLGATTGGIHDKDNSQNNTYRENYIEFSLANKTGAGIQVSAQDNSDQIHMHHNLLINAGISLGIQCFQETCYMRDHHVHHNTLSNGRVSMNWGPFNPTSYGTNVNHNIISSGTSAPYVGLSCQQRLSVSSASKLSTGANLIESTSSLAFKDSECTGNDMSWSIWQGTYGMDTVSSGSTVSSVSALVGAGPGIGLPVGDVRRTLRGHQYP